jgi:GGDEF domain-containing protein
MRRDDGYQLMAVGDAPVKGELPLPLTDSAVLRLIEEVERNREPAIVGGALAPDWVELQSRAAERFSRVLVPIYSRQALSGVLLLDAEGAGGFDEPSIELLASIADQAGIAIENAHLFGEVQRLATEDSLTGLPNRRHFMEIAKQEFERARRFAHPLSVIMLDIDHFKQVNDEHGHNTGDEILKLVAHRCRASAVPQIWHWPLTLIIADTGCRAMTPSPVVAGPPDRRPRPGGAGNAL